MKWGESSRVLRVAVLCGVALMVGAGGGRRASVIEAQKYQDPMSQKNQDPIPMPSASQPGGILSDDISSMDPLSRARMKEDRVKAMNDSRHKRLEDDVGKMMELTTELKAEVDKANKDELSLDVMRKAAEIEKLAHDVQNRMKN